LDQFFLDSLFVVISIIESHDYSFYLPLQIDFFAVALFLPCSLALLSAFGYRFPITATPSNLIRPALT
jgi:hypothetical protein